MTNERGYVLISVVSVLLLLAAISALATSQLQTGSAGVTRDFAYDRARLLASSGIAHARWLITESEECSASARTFERVLGDGRYSVTIEPAGDAIVAIHSVGATANAEVAISRPDVALMTAPQTIILSAGSEGQATYIANGASSLANASGRPYLQIGNVDGRLEHALLTFDLSSLPVDADVQRARLEWYQQASGNGVAQVHPVQRPWRANSVTWMSAQQNAQWWQPGGDYQPDSHADVSLASAGWRVAVVTAVVDAWHSGRLPNNGLLIAAAKTEIETKAVIDNGAFETAPRLHIDYVCPCTQRCVGGAAEVRTGSAL